jgi:hypothetical protein
VLNNQEKPLQGKKNHKAKLEIERLLYSFQQGMANDGSENRVL